MTAFPRLAKADIRHVLILLFFGGCFYIAGNGLLGLTHPDEVFYSQTAREMIAHHSWNVPYLFDQPQFEKPILTYWLIRVGYIMFGVGSFGARFFPAVFGLLGILSVYLLLRAGKQEPQKALLCSLVLASGALYVGLSKMVFTDMIFTVFILQALAAFYWAYNQPGRKNLGLILFFVFSALAVLTKGPLGFLLPAATVILFLLIRRQMRFLACSGLLGGALLFVLIAVPWYWAIIKTYGAMFADEFFYNDHIRRLMEAEHGSNDHWFFYPLTMIVCTFPWSLFLIAAVPSLVRELHKPGTDNLYLFLTCWVLVVFVTFEVAHSKLVSYILPLFPAIAIIEGDYIYRRVLGNRNKVSLPISVSAAALGLTCLGLVLFSRKIAPLTSFAGLFCVLGAGFALAAAIFYFAIRKRPHVAVRLMCLVVPMLFLLGLAIHKDYESSASSQKACEYLEDTVKPVGTILCSPKYVRSVRFFTQRLVAVVDIGGGPFFSPHPITALYADWQLANFLKTQKATYCVVSKGGYCDLQRFAGVGKWKLTLLKQVGDEYLAELESWNPET